MEPNAMSLDECRRWLARDGKRPAPSGVGCNSAVYWHENDMIPATLDAAADAMPDVRFLRIRKRTRVETEAIEWDADAVCCSNEFFSFSKAATASTELLARFRLAVACRMAMKENAKD